MTAIIREERIGGQRLILGDCLDVMKEIGRFDAVVTDPPYGISSGVVADRPSKWQRKRGLVRRDWDARAPSADLFGSTPSIVWGGNYIGLPPSRCWLVWYKRDAVRTMADCELAWTNFDANARVFDWTIAATNAERAGHPTQKPVALLEWCLGFVPKAETILDPFMGSGTTLVACQRLGRMGTGVEIDPEYWSIACERVHKAWQQADLFIQSPIAPEPQQERLFDV